MATDIYLYIEGIKGESRDAGHQGWLECDAVDWGVHQPASAIASSTGRTLGRSHHNTIAIARQSDVATPILLQACCMGRTMPRATIEFMRADGGTPLKYFVLELEHVLVCEVAPGVSEGQPMREYLALAFAKVRWNYAQQSLAGGMLGHTVGGWDLASNKRLA